MRPSSELVINSANGATVNAAAIKCDQVFQCSVLVTTTSTLTGTAKIQVSNDPYTPGQTPTNWSDLASASVAVAGAGTVNIPKIDLCYNWIRVVWTNSTNTGTLKVYVRTNAI